MEHLDVDSFADFLYFHDFVEYFVDRGYERGKTIRAAPYDWRLAAGVYRLTLCLLPIANYTCN